MVGSVNVATVSDLRSYLSWVGLPQLEAALQETLVETHCRRFERMIQALMLLDKARCERIVERLSSLPEDAFSRVFLAPETGYRLGYDGAAAVERTADFLECAMLVEEIRLGQIKNVYQPLWSALGDCYVAGPVRRQDDLHQKRSRFFAPESNYAAPSIDGIVIDAVSPSATIKLPQIAGEASAMFEDDFRVALERIGLAIALIGRISPEAHMMLKAFTAVIVARYDHSAPGFYTSASTTFCLKRPVLRNPFVPAATISEIADGLVHEAIHCVCDLVEIRGGRWLVGDETSAELASIKVASPWTQRPLDLHTYLQACWVWYGLWKFWLAGLQGDIPDQPDVVRCAARAYRGFHGGAAIERLQPKRAYVGTEVFEALASAQDSVLDDVRIMKLIPA